MDHAEQTPQAPPRPRTIEEAAGTQPEHIQALDHSSGESNGVGGRDTRSQSSSTHFINAPDNWYADFERVPISPTVRSRDGHAQLSSQHQSLSNPGLLAPARNPSGIDWIVPAEEKATTRSTIGQRLQPTIENAVIERNKYAKKALWTGHALNVAIGLQVLLGALTTGLAAALTTGKQAQVSTTILGGLSTMVASYLARARGSGEPELSITRAKDLEHFLRECKTFYMDHGHEYGTPENGLDHDLESLRRRFEELLGNTNGERRLSPTGITGTRAAL